MESKNELYPIFLKVHQLQVLIVGGGYVGFEKLGFLLKSSPHAQVTVVSETFLEEVVELANKHRVILFQTRYDPRHLANKQIVIAATNVPEVNIQIYRDCKVENILVNVADTPEYCDFYMGGIVTKGNLKIAISTNGKSPTMAKRIRQFLEDIIPEDINVLLDNLNRYRSTLKGGFESKVQEMNRMTEHFINK